ncbi:MAG: dihydroorotase [Proteobacteria bacterium]|nr:dihydroorotase [Pseudomonadota bacterium]MBU1709103.1 dihydroorotase [Pseudomonadota bacterium]
MVESVNNTPILLVNGRIIDPANGIDQNGSLLLENGRVSRLFFGKKLSAPRGTRKFDVGGKWVIPGLIDMHVHLREPGEEYKETIASGTRAAAAGGFTAVACMPNTKPFNDSWAVTAQILSKARNCSAKVYPVGAISKFGRGETLAEYGEMKEAGVVAISDDGCPVENSQLMRRALEYSSHFKLLVISHSEEKTLSHLGVMNEGYQSTRLGLRGIPRVAEEIMIYRDLSLAEYTGQPIHIAHVSTRESVSLIRRAKERGCKITAETAPHYFTLTDEAVDSYDTMAKMNPPLRSPDDIAAIKEGLADGTLDVIATDHAPHSTLDKDLEFDLAANGIIGLETAVPLALNLVREGTIDATRFVELLSSNPARLLGVEGGTLRVGGPADVVVIDPDKDFVYTEDQVVSKSKNSPFLDWHMRGKAVLTIKDGEITYSDS